MRIIGNLLLNECYDSFSGSIKFWSSERNTENTLTHFYFNEESRYYEENCSDNVFSTTLVWAWTESTRSNESHEKETKRIHASAANWLHIRTGNIDWHKCGHFINEPGEIDVFVVERWMEWFMLLPKYRSAREASHHPAFMDICQTISTTW